jgi:putative ABC transport system ATP-binding protein
MTPTLELDRVTRVHGSGHVRVEALSDVSLVSAPGELVAIMGPSGSGKTTLISLAGGLDQPTSGRVLVQGQELSDLSIQGLAAWRRRHIGYVFQQFNLIEALTACENVALPLELDGVTRRMARAQALKALELVEMDMLANRFPAEMSGGEQQRVAIARAMVGERVLLLADEPTGALDSASGETVLRLLRQHCDRGGSGLLVTHDARFAAWADHVVFLRDGKIIDKTQQSKPESLLTDPLAG